jgi:hypothetical protein
MSPIPSGQWHVLKETDGTVWLKNQFHTPIQGHQLRQKKNFFLIPGLNPEEDFTVRVLSCAWHYEWREMSGCPAEPFPPVYGRMVGWLAFLTSCQEFTRRLKHKAQCARSPQLALVKTFCTGFQRTVTNSHNSMLLVCSDGKCKKGNEKIWVGPDARRFKTYWGKNV